MAFLEHQNCSGIVLDKESFGVGGDYCACDFVHVVHRLGDDIGNLGYRDHDNFAEFHCLTAVAFR